MALAANTGIKPSGCMPFIRLTFFLHVSFSLLSHSLTHSLSLAHSLSHSLFLQNKLCRQQNTMLVYVTERYIKLLNLSFPLSLSLSHCLSVCSSLSLSFFSHSISTFSSISLFQYPFIHLDILSICLSVCQCILASKNRLSNQFLHATSIWLSICLSVCLSPVCLRFIHQADQGDAGPTVHLSVHLSTHIL